MKRLTAEQRIERAHVQLMQSPDWCLFSGLFMIGKVEVRDDVLTASTNGRDVTYGRKFVDSLDDRMLNFLVIHETMHKAYRHLTTWRGIWQEDPQLANAAMDYVINLQIVDTDKHEVLVAKPRDADGNVIGLFDEQYRGMDTKQVYELLKKKQGQGDGAGLDEHDWEGAANIDEKEAEELANEIDHALREGSMLAGKMKGNVPRGIDELLHPKVNWREALHEFIKTIMKGGDQSTWRKPSRRFLASGIVMPSTFSEKTGTVAIAVDTSGSIGGKEIAQFLGEVKAICDDVAPEAVELLYWDSHVAQHETYREGAVATLIESTRPKGGGGTAPDCIPAFLKDKLINAQCVVVLTDGQFFGHDAAKWAESAPVLWCVVGNRHFNPKVGQSVFVE